MSGFSIEQIKSRVRLLVGVFLLAVICISALGILSERRDVTASAERLACGYSRALAEHTESAFSEADGTLRILVRELREKGGLQRIDREEFSAEMRRLMKDSPQIGTLFVVDREGIMRLNSDAFPGRELSVADRDYFRQYLATPGLDLSFGKPIVSRLVHRPRFNLMRPLNRPGRPFDGLMALGFEAQYFKRFFNPEKLGMRGVVLLLRDDGVPLVYEPAFPGSQQVDFRRSKLFREELPRSPAGVFHMARSLVRKEPLILAYQRLNRYPVVAVIGFDEDDVLAPWSRRAIRQSALTLALCLVLVVLTRLLFKHLDRLQAAQCQLGEQQAQLAIKAAQIDAVRDVILQVDLEGRLVHFNQELCRLTGYRREELAGLTLHELLAPEVRGRVAGNMATIRKFGEATFESAYLRSDGGVTPMEVHAQLIESEGRQLIVSMSRDITQRRRGEIRERNRLKTLERIASDAPLDELLECIVRFVERESPGALCSVLLADEGGARLRHGSAPSLPEAYNRAVDGLRIGNGQGSCGSAAFLRRRVVVEEIEGHPYWQGFAPARQAGLKACWSEPLLASNGTLLGTLAIYHREPCAPGEEELLLIESAAHLAGIVIGRVRGDESRRLLEEQLRHSQKIEAVGQLAAGVAHDFNNLLTPIIVYSDMLRRGLPEGGAQLRMVDAVSQAAHKASELTQKLLSFGRKQVLKVAPLDLNEVVGSFRDIMRTTVRESIAIELRLAPGVARVQADRGQLEQVILNLLVNAQDAIDGTGSITLETGHLVLDDEYVVRHPGARAGAYVLLALSDDGCGMSDDILQRIYEPFFTTKEVGRGTGLGLATVYGIVQRHLGYINVKSRPGEGTRFELFLPAGQAAPGPSPRPESLPCPPDAGDGRTILLVEDNAMIRVMAGELLCSFGYRVLAADTPSGALELCAGGQRIDLLASDVILPEMSGPELYQRLAAARPGLPVLYISGYSNDLVPPALQQEGSFLAKPFTMEQFLERVARLLSPAGARPAAAEGEDTA